MALGQAGYLTFSLSLSRLGQAGYSAVEVRGCTLERHAWAAWHAGPDSRRACLRAEGNRVLGREWFCARRPGERPPRYCGRCNDTGCDWCIQVP